MKKIIAALVAATLALSPACVMAADSSAESSVPEVNWEDIEAIEGASEVIESGEFQTFDEVAVQVWVPNAMQRVELDDEAKEQGFIASFQDEDQTCAMNVTYTEADIADIDEYAEKAAAVDGVEELEKCILNGLDAVSYEMPESDAGVISVITDLGNIVEFTFVPMSDEDYKQVCSFMMASIMPEE